MARAAAEGAARSLARGIAVVDLLRARGPATMAEIVDALAIPKSTACETVGVMAQAGWVAPAADGRLALGRRPHEVGQGYAEGEGLLREGGPVVRGLRDEPGDTVQLPALDGDRMAVLLKEEGLRAVRIISRAGSRVPVNWAAAGRLLVSDLEDDALRRLLAATVAPSPTGRAETDVERLVAQVRASRAQGFAVGIGETDEHAGCVAAPVLDAAGRCVAAISIAAPEQRLAAPHRQALVEAVVRAAGALSRRLA
jgi:DNA-binding IclR family transcriptional regulator